MKCYLIILATLLMACSNKKHEMSITSPFTENEVLLELDKAFSDSYPLSTSGKKTNYHFFLELEPPYTIVAGSRIHLYSDSLSWAVVFETNGYNTRAGIPQIELIYVGNSINYDNYNIFGQEEPSNMSFIELMTSTDVNAMGNKEGSAMEQFELVDKNLNSIKIRNRIVNFKNDYKELEKFGIKVRDYDNPNHLLGFQDLFRYLYEVQPDVISATDAEIRGRLLGDIPRLITIDKFHYTDYYLRDTLPSQQELFQLIAKVLVTRDISYWKPTLPPNNHWSNWESGNL